MTGGSERGLLLGTRRKTAHLDLETEGLVFHGPVGYLVHVCHLGVVEDLGCVGVAGHLGLVENCEGAVHPGVAVHPGMVGHPGVVEHLVSAGSAEDV